MNSLKTKHWTQTMSLDTGDFFRTVNVMTFFLLRPSKGRVESTFKLKIYMWCLHWKLLGVRISSPTLDRKDSIWNDMRIIYISECCESQLTVLRGLCLEDMLYNVVSAVASIFYCRLLLIPLKFVIYAAVHKKEILWMLIKWILLSKTLV